MEGRKVKCRMCMQEGSCGGGKDTKAVREGRVSKTRGDQVREATYHVAEKSGEGWAGDT